ncbi:MAG: glycosyltransferase family 2 protein [Rhodospirillales bacterium]|jgi:GT2 family glycosyltransferase|nr:glycosyltransferase family 2 protein [Rhodospirillales bacterium]MDP6805529.1 glycosyltransferase family 2 protein [Rhodospirillales bacterium]
MTEPAPGSTADPWQRITVVMVVHNSRYILPASLGALADALRVVVVDTLSTDGTAEAATSLHPSARVIRNTEDHGLAWASNLGFAAAETEYVLHVNPDAEIAAGCVERLIATADSCPGAIAVAPLLTNGRGDMELDVMHAWERNHHKTAHPPSGPFCTWFLTGAVVLWRTGAFRAIGGFDESFFLYAEDADISLRATRAGYSLVVDPSAEARHLGGASERASVRTRLRKDWNMTWGHLHCERKHGGETEAKAEASRFVRRFMREALFGLATLRPRKFLSNLTKARAARGFLRGDPPWGRS